MTDTPKLFGEKSVVEAAAKRLAEINDHNGWCPMWDEADEEERQRLTEDATAVLAAAGAALDREGLIATAQAALASPRPRDPADYQAQWEWEARRVIAALLPTEGGADHG